MRGRKNLWNSGTLPIPAWIGDRDHPSVRREWARLVRSSPDSLDRAAVFGPLVWYLNSGDLADWAKEFSRGWESFVGLLVGTVSSGDWHHAWARYWRAQARRKYGLERARRLIGYETPSEYFVAAVLHDAVLFWRAGWRLSRCLWGHYFFTGSTRGPLPRVCPLHFPLVNQERVRRQRQRRRRGKAQGAR